MQKLIIGIAPNMSVEIHSDSIKQVIEQAAFWNSLPAACPLCNAPVAFFHRDPKDNDYWGLNCTGPVTHESNFGVYKTTEKGFYYKGTRSWTKAYDAYQVDSEQQSTNGNQQAQANSVSPARQEFPEQPLAGNLNELITAKQLGMIRALAREANINEDVECNSVMKCGTSELSKSAASMFIKHLQEFQRMPQTAPAMTPVQQMTSTLPPVNPNPPPAPPTPPIAPRPPEDDDIPF
jgi:hypothetical protein